MAGALYEDGGGFLTADGAMTLAFGCAYGGSTVVYTGTSMLPPERVIRRWNVPGLTHADLDCRARKFMAENNVHLLEDDLINENNKLFVEGCRKLDYDVQQFPVNIKGCRGSSLCNLGCPNQAKQGTDRVQLPRAEQNGVEVDHALPGADASAKRPSPCASPPSRRARRAIPRRGSRANTRSTPRSSCCAPAP